VKILHVPYCYYPDPVGGTEVYVEALATKLQSMDVVSIIAAPAETNAEYNVRGIAVRRFEKSNTHDIQELYGGGDPRAADSFEKILRQDKPDVLHLHAFSPAVSILLVRKAQQHGIPTIFTYHTPTVSCPRGTLMRWGTDICDGRVDVTTCTQCVLTQHRVPKSLTRFFTHLPNALRTTAYKLGIRGPAGLLLQMPDLIALRQSAFKELLLSVDHLVAVAEWVRILLIRNGAPADKISLSRQGLCHSSSLKPTGMVPESDQLKVAYFGRMHPTKGIDVLIKAVLQARDVDLKLDIFAVTQGPDDAKYASANMELAKADSRISFHDSVAPDKVGLTLCEYDLLAVPSVWLESGPMTVLEAFGAGVPVLGSDLGGIAEIVTDRVDGLLLQPGSPHAWANALRVCARDRELLRQLRKGIRAPRTMDAVAGEMYELYSKIFSQRCAQSVRSADAPALRS
jgi:glycosyltransferase involved in cell wall biosynthesis